MVDVRYEYDAAPTWLPSGTSPPTVGGYLGRATGVTDRGQRSAVAYDRRGLAIWTARQMALIPNRLALTTSAMGATYPTITEPTPTSGSVAFDEAHTYVETTTSNHAGAARRLTLPRDPDFGGGPGPLVVGEMGVNRMGLLENAHLIIGGATPTAVTGYAQYDQYGSEQLAIMGPTNTLYRQSQYDARRRPVGLTYSRVVSPMATPGSLQAVVYPVHEGYNWDAANNLTVVNSEPWSTGRINAPGHRGRSMVISHDTLYRVSNVEFRYGYYYIPTTDPTTDWRNDATPSNANDPMHPRPAPRVGALPANRVENINYAYDWLGNQTEWHDDQSSFFERSIGEITNGRETGNRPGALYLSTNIPGSGGIESTWGGAGWVEVNYGQGGNVSDYTVHGQCQDRVEPSSCSDTDDKLANRISNFQTNCTCATEQHFSLRWDELNRLVEGRRFDRVGGSVGSGTGAWTYAARMRYRYDGANQRTVKESFEATGINTASRVALFVYPGDFERRGLVRNTTTYDAVTTGVDATETQYMVAGARIVWDPATSATSPNFDRNRRITYALTDLLQTSSGVVDLVSGELLELSTYYPNGARENLWASDSNAPLEPMGFTGKEADEEIGLTYFGERWLMPRLGRWASPDPLHVHASGGGEALNSYHYVSGNLLQARDPFGLCGEPGNPCGQAGATMRAATDRRRPSGVQSNTQREHARRVETRERSGAAGGFLFGLAEFGVACAHAVGGFAFSMLLVRGDTPPSRLQRRTPNEVEEDEAGERGFDAGYALSTLAGPLIAGRMRASATPPRSAFGSLTRGTPAARIAAANVEDAMAAAGVGARRHQSVTVITHADGSVSVGISGGAPAQIEAIRARLPSNYTVGTQAVDTAGAVQAANASPPGRCSEWFAARAAQGNTSRATGFETIWRSANEIPAHLQTAVPGQMHACATCGASPQLARAVGAPPIPIPQTQAGTVANGTAAAGRAAQPDTRGRE
jgi:RHS repeat-associated protein